MKIPRMKELAETSSFLGFPIGAVIVDVFRALGIDDSDLPNIVPEIPTGMSDEESVAWMKAFLPSVYAKVEALEFAA